VLAPPPLSSTRYPADPSATRPRVGLLPLLAQRPSPLCRPGLVSYADRVELEFRAEVWFWRGPSPFHFVTVPEGPSGELQAASALVTYGWGMIPVEVQIGSTRWRTSLFPKNGNYLVPLKALVRRSEGIDLGDTVTVKLVVEA
jgi:hypothetical protein